VAFFAAFGVIFSACYALWLYRRVIFGVLTKDTLKSILDLDRREVIVFVPLVILTILFGFYPAPILDATAASVQLVADNFANAIGSMPLVAAAH
jgi:NADH-quinone oxidoreductase subunit M